MIACPPAVVLSDLLSGNLAPDRASALREHVEVCPSCLIALDRLTDDAELTSWIAEGAGGPKPDGEIAAEGYRVNPSMPPKAIGPYAIEAEVGRGGMGVVYRARDRAIDRVVALKVLLAEKIEPDARDRFLREVRAAARVEHDHIVRVYATSGPADPAPFFAMEYLAGPTLADRVRDPAGIDPRWAAGVVAQVASGLEAAHAAGLVHRDVKPANVLFDASGRAKIGDFGLALLEGEASGLTREGVIAGTPAYLSPEQARGSPADARSDVYALGVTLYECLAGESPFRGSPHRVVYQVLHDEPPPPRTFRESIPRDLETIALKAMAKEPSRRYASVSDLADDLGRFLRGEPIRARPSGPVERAWCWSRNNARITALAAVAILLLSALAVGATVSAFWIAAERAEAVRQARRAEARRGLAEDAFTTLVGEVQDQLGTRPGTLALRRTLLETARDGLGRVAQANDSRIDAKSVSALIKLGDLDLVIGRTADAKLEFAQAAEMAEQIVKADPASVPRPTRAGRRLDPSGDVSRLGYAPKPPPGPYRKAVDIGRALTAERPDDLEIRRDVWTAQNKLADVLELNGDPTGAKDLYESSLKSLLTETSQTEKDRARHLSDLRFTYSRMGTLALHQEDPTALDSLKKSLDAARSLCEIDPENPAWRRERALALDALGVASAEFGDLEAGERHLNALVADRRAAAEADPSDLEVRRALALAHQHLGDVRKARRDFEGSRASYLAAKSLYDDLARRDPRSLRAHMDRMIILRWLAILEFEAGRFEEAAQWVEKEIAAQAEPNLPAQSDRAAWVNEARTYLGAFRAAPRVIEEPAFARTLTPDIASYLLRQRAALLAYAGRHAEAAEAAENLLLIRGEPIVPVVAARVYNLAARSLPPDRQDLRASYREKAVAALRVAIQADAKAARRVAWDPDLAELRSYAAKLLVPESAKDPTPPGK